MTYRNTWVAYAFDPHPWVQHHIPHVQIGVNRVAGRVTRAGSEVFTLTVLAGGVPAGALATGGPDAGTRRAGTIRLSVGEWPWGYSFYDVISHELGHCFGLPHVSHPRSFLYPFVSPLPAYWDGSFLPEDVAAFAAAGWTVHAAGPLAAVKGDVPTARTGHAPPVRCPCC